MYLAKTATEDRRFALKCATDEAHARVEGIVQNAGMFGYQVTEFGGVDVMKWVELPDPVPGPGQLRVAVRASGINFMYNRSAPSNIPCHWV